MAALPQRFSANTLFILCLSILIGASASLSAPAEGTKTGPCAAALDRLLTENWGFPWNEEREKTDELLKICDSDETMPNDTHALVHAFMRYLRGEKDDALDAWRRGAEVGDVRAMVVAADAVLVSGAEGAASEAYKLYRRAADAGSALGLSKVGWLYEEGLHVPEDDREAFGWYLRAAQAGEPTAMASVAHAYELGHGVERNMRMAIHWYKKSGAAGRLASYNWLGATYQSGIDVPRNWARAIHYYRIAAYRGYSLSMQNLGWLYMHAEGLKPDYAKAFFWYKKAYDAGEPIAGDSLGILYSKGLGVERDPAKAFSYFLAAAEWGWADAMANLSVFYAESSRYPEAYFWAVLAIRYGMMETSPSVADLERLLTPKSVAALKARADEWDAGEEQPDFSDLRP